MLMLQRRNKSGGVVCNVKNKPEGEQYPQRYSSALFLILRSLVKIKKAKHILATKKTLFFLGCFTKVFLCLIHNHKYVFLSGVPG